MELALKVDRTQQLGGATLWVAVTDKIGHINQCIALTDALGAVPARIERIRGFNLRDRRGVKVLKLLRSLFRSLAILRGVPAGPLVLVISGRSSEYAAKLLRWRLGARLFVISVGAPIRFLGNVDLAVMSEAILPKWRRRRDAYGEGVRVEELTICGALARKFDMPAAEGGSRRVAVFVGGENKNFALDGPKFRTAMAQIAAFAGTEPGAVEIVLSRRTSQRTEAIVREAVAGSPVAVHGRDDSGAYKSLLGRADTFVVTPDSVTMLSEVCLTGKPVYALDLDILPGSDGEGERLVDAMVARGVVRRFEGSVDSFTPSGRLDEAERIAPIIAARIRDWAGPS